MSCERRRAESCPVRLHLVGWAALGGATHVVCCGYPGSYPPQRQIVIEFVEIGRQLADVLTKPFGRLRLTELKKMIGMEGFKDSRRIRGRIVR